MLESWLVAVEPRADADIPRPIAKTNEPVNGLLRALAKNKRRARRRDLLWFQSKLASRGIKMLKPGKQTLKPAKHKLRLHHAASRSFKLRKFRVTKARKRRYKRMATPAVERLDSYMSNMPIDSDRPFVINVEDSMIARIRVGYEPMATPAVERLDSYMSNMPIDSDQFFGINVDDAGMLVDDGIPVGYEPMDTPAVEDVDSSMSIMPIDYEQFLVHNVEDSVDAGMPVDAEMQGLSGTMGQLDLGGNAPQERDDSEGMPELVGAMGRLEFDGTNML